MVTVQSSQIPPPHALLLVPGVHVVPLQQPAFALHDPLVHGMMHSCEAESHPLLVEGQSEGPLQPQKPPAAVGRHTLPLNPALFAAPQSVQAVPVAPHSLVVVPAWQVPVALEQQPPWQRLVPLPQLRAQRAVAESQAYPTGQSSSLMHPHWR
jgi:hypothetical protein